MRQESVDVSGDYIFYKSAYEFLKYLEKISGFKLLTESVLKNDGILRRTMYIDLTRSWREYHGAYH